MATPKTFYIKNSAASGSNFGSLADGTSQGTGATTTIWTVGTVANGNWSLMAFNATQGTGTFSTTAVPNASPNNSAPDCWRSENTYSGTFDSTNWTFNLGLRSTVGTLQSGRMNFRLWASANADGTSARELTAGRQTASTITLSTITTNDSSLAVNLGNVSLNNEYLFWQVSWEITTAGNLSSDDAIIQLDPSNSLVTTPNFVPLGSWYPTYPDFAKAPLGLPAAIDPFYMVGPVLPIWPFTESTSTTVFVKPKIVPLIKWEHPLAQYLTLCWVPEYGDLLTGAQTTVGANANFGTNLNGQCVKITAAGSSTAWASLQTVPTSSPLFLNMIKDATVVIFANITTAPTTGNVLFSVGLTGKNSGLAIKADNTTATKFRLGYTTSGNVARNASGTQTGYWNVGSMTCYSFSRDTGSGKLVTYKNGTLSESVTDPSAAALSIENDLKPTFFNAAPSVTGSVIGEGSLVYVFSKSLSANEHLELSANPLALLEYGDYPQYLFATVPALNWLPDYPSFAPGPISIPTAQQQTLAWNPSTPSAAVAPTLAWQPEFPDFAKAATPLVNTGYIAWTPQPDASVRNFADGWQPEYPDFAKAPAPLVNIGFFAWDPATPASIQSAYLGWLPTYPDFARTATPLVNIGWLAWTPQPDQNVRKYFNGWQPDYPDFARTQAPLVNTGLVAWTPQPDASVRNFADGWQPEYPDFARVSLPNVNTGFFAWDPATPASIEFPGIDWLPTYPDFARASLPNVNTGFIAWDPATAASIQFAGLGWQPEYPDFAKALTPLVQTGLVVWTPQPDASVRNFADGWLPTYPDFARTATPLVNTGFFAWNPKTIPNAVTVLFWQPTYPDFARASLPNVNTGIFAWDPATPQETRFAGIDWLPTYPDFARAPLSLVNTGIFAFSKHRSTRARWFNAGFNAGFTGTI